MTALYVNDNLELSLEVVKLTPPLSQAQGHITADYEPSSTTLQLCGRTSIFDADNTIFYAIKNCGSMLLHKLWDTSKPTTQLYGNSPNFICWSCGGVCKNVKHIL